MAYLLTRQGDSVVQQECGNRAKNDQMPATKVSDSSLPRRCALRLFGAAIPGLALLPEEKLPPVRAITRGPKFHWFGYYDKLQFDPTGRYALGNQVAFEHRAPAPDDVIRVGMIDLKDGDRWIELGESRAWNWQQGCMLQWLPGSRSEVVWNDRQDGRFVSHILDVHTRKRRTLPGPVYGVSPDGRWAVAPDFRRLADMRPGYGYAGIPDPNAAVPAPENAGIWHLDLATGKQRLILSLADVLKHPETENPWTEADKHWFNHLLVSPDGKRFIFLHRFRPQARLGHTTRMFTASPDGKDPFVLNPSRMTSHFCWRDPKHVLAYARHASHGNRFYLFEDRSRNVEAVGPEVMTGDGHCSYLPGERWILNDTYRDKDGNQGLYLYDTRTGAQRWLGRFLSPPPYWEDKEYRSWRCDLHPRFTPDGQWAAIDSPHNAPGRQIYLVDLRGIVGKQA